MGTVWFLGTLLVLAFCGRHHDVKDPDLVLPEVVTFVRIQYDHYGPQQVGPAWVAPWCHDFPEAEQNLLTQLSTNTSIETTVHWVMRFDNPKIMNHPVLYVSEPGYWNCTEAEIEGLREYLRQGGFVIFDDFRDVAGEWSNFESCMSKVFPDRTLAVLELIIPCFIHPTISRLSDMEPPYRLVEGAPTFYGLSDNSGRLQVVAAFNNDLGDYWEWTTHLFPSQASQDKATKLGINFILYALNHQPGSQQ